MNYQLAWIIIAHSCFVYGLVDHVPDQVLTFLLLGDWGKGGTTGNYGSRKLTHDVDMVDVELVRAGDFGKDVLKKKKVVRQMQVATAMGTYSSEANPQPSFLLALGDNFYDNGVYSSTDSLWQYLWKDVYLQYETLNIPWYPVFGNHDYGYGATGVQAQLTRTQEHTDDDIWIFPSTNYTKRFDIPGEAGGSVVVVFVDTTTLAPSINRCCNENGGVSAEVQLQRIENQLGNIERMLNDTVTNPPTWLLVAGHYPIYSASSGGDVAELKTYLLPLLQKYNVHAYICGHDHTAEHLQAEGYDTEFFVVGAGSMQDTVDYSTEGQLIWGGPMYSSFASMNATVDDLTIAFRDYNGTVRYNYTLTNPNALPAQPSADPTPSPAGGHDDNGTGTGSGDERRISIFSWAFWSSQATNASSKDIAIASGGVAVMALMIFLCFALHRRRTRSKEEQAKAKFLQISRTNSVMRSPARRGRVSAFYSRKPYVELHEVGGDLEAGHGVAGGYAEDEFDLSEKEVTGPSKEHSRQPSRHQQQQSGKYAPLVQETMSTAPFSFESGEPTSNTTNTAATQDPSPHGTPRSSPKISPKGSAGSSPRSGHSPPATSEPSSAIAIGRSRAGTLWESGHIRGTSRSGSHGPFFSGSGGGDALVFGTQASSRDALASSMHEKVGEHRNHSLSSSLYGTGTGTTGTAEHSRSSSSSRGETVHSDVSFSHADLYSTELSSEQLAVGSAWLSTHARSPSSVVPVPPPPSPSSEKMSIADRLLPNEVLNPMMYSPAPGKPPRRPVVSPGSRPADVLSSPSEHSSAGGGTPVPRSSPPRDPASLLSSNEIRMSPLPQGKPHRRTTTSPM